ncbi:hypothetical protein, partial [Ilumatobacter sp.]|uniref:hypothetical protein n=1 Tax=Ilumatobacter sp. TaxID=1967498 RepID=UPI003750D70E
PTRALWIPLALGRPLGSAEDPVVADPCGAWPDVVRRQWCRARPGRRRSSCTRVDCRGRVDHRAARFGRGQRNEWAYDMPLPVRHLADDLRTFYHEAIAAQPGSAAPNHDALNDWIFGGTALGNTL